MSNKITLHPGEIDRVDILILYRWHITKLMLDFTRENTLGMPSQIYHIEMHDQNPGWILLKRFFIKFKKYNGVLKKSILRYENDIECGKLMRFPTKTWLSMWESIFSLVRKGNYEAFLDFAQLMPEQFKMLDRYLDYSYLKEELKKRYKYLTKKHKIRYILDQDREYIVRVIVKDRVNLMPNRRKVKRKGLE